MTNDYEQMSMRELSNHIERWWTHIKFAETTVEYLESIYQAKAQCMRDQRRASETPETMKQTD